MPMLPLADSAGSFPWQCMTVALAAAAVAVFAYAKVTKRRLRGELDQKLRDDARTRMVIGQMPAIVWTTDADLRFTSCEGGGLVGLPELPPKMVGLSFYEYFRTTDRNFLPIAKHLEALAGASCNYEMYWNQHTFLVHCEPLRDAAGRIVGTVGVSADISPRVAAERALAASEAKNRALLTAIPDVMFRLDRDGTILEFIDKDLVDPAESRVGKNVRDVFPTDVAARFVDKAKLAVAEQATQHFEYETGPARNRRHYEARVVACQDHDVLAIVRNVTPWRTAPTTRRPDLQRA